MMAVLRSMSGSQADHVRKDLESHFKKFKLRIIIETNLKIMSFLDLSKEANHAGEI